MAPLLKGRRRSMVAPQAQMATAGTGVDCGIPRAVLLRYLSCATRVIEATGRGE
jgi:hypothetical protein